MQRPVVRRIYSPEGDGKRQFPQLERQWRQPVLRLVGSPVGSRVPEGRVCGTPREVGPREQGLLASHGAYQLGAAEW